MQFLKEHLSPGNYEWSNEQVYTGNASRRRYNRVDGNQLLFIINQFAALLPSFDVDKGVRIQKILMYELPVEAKSELSVIKWLNKKIVA